MRSAAGYVVVAVLATAGCSVTVRPPPVSTRSPYGMPSTTPFTGGEPELVATFKSLIKDLRSAATVTAACERLHRLRQTFQYDIPSRTRSSLSDGEFILVYGAANNCASDPEDAAVALQHILTHRANREKLESRRP